jgi:hypothetical protein
VNRVVNSKRTDNLPSGRGFKVKLSWNEFVIDPPPPLVLASVPVNADRHSRMKRIRHGIKLYKSSLRVSATRVHKPVDRGSVATPEPGSSSKIEVRNQVLATDLNHSINMRSPLAVWASQVYYRTLSQATLQGSSKVSPTKRWSSQVRYQHTSTSGGWQTVIGLEIHAQIKTGRKLFSG